MIDKTGGPAFPVVFEHNECVSEQEGMTLRDYFAAKAMQGMCAVDDGDSVNIHYMSCVAYAIADAMLAARSL